MNKLFSPFSLPSLLTEIYIENGLLDADFIKGFCTSKIILISDPLVKNLYGEKLSQKLGAHLIVIPHGEEAKTKTIQEEVLKHLFYLNCDRNTTLIALGGGATTDLVGFVASIYLRGVPLLFIPTTLLAMVDACIGGKTAINTSFGKNLLGTFYYPKAIFIDLETLKTLPEHERLNGVSEIFKMGLVYDPSLFLLHKEEDLIKKAINCKVKIVEQDPKEQGLRHVLNFGHTIGHALETLSQYKISHGKAVAIGCLVESHLSMRLGYLSSSSFQKIQELYLPFFLQLPNQYTQKDLLQTLTYDKKRYLNDLRFVLIDEIGHAIPFDGSYCRCVSQEDLIPSLLWMEYSYG